MNKFKKWLIHKLGGFTVQERITHEIIRSTAPIVRLSGTIAVPNYIKQPDALELSYYMNEELGNKIGNMLIKNNYIDIKQERTEDGYGIIVRGTVYVAKKHLNI